MPLIIDGQRVEVPGVTVNTWEDTGITVPEGEPWNFSRGGRTPQQITLHWTAGFRGDPAALRDVFVRRRVAAQLFMDRHGVVHQYIDLNRAAIHASPSSTSIGIEIQNPGLPVGGRTDGRELYSTNLVGRDYNFLRFTDAQIRATRQICRVICRHYRIPYRVPTNRNGSLMTTRFRRSQVRSYRGICGHYHTSTRGKLDPGTDLLQAILDDVGSSTTSSRRSRRRGGSSRSRRRAAPEPIEETPERIAAITQGRVETPSDGSPFPYAIFAPEDVDASSLDPHVDDAAVIDPADARSIVRQPFEAFKAQVDAMKAVETLDFAQAATVLAVFTVGDNGDPVNLNREIFGAPTFHNIFESQSLPEGVDILYQERPIASLESFQVTIQQPSQGGVVGYSIGTLTIRVHNPSTISRSHPKGKYISYLMTQGYPVRVRYGVEHPRSDLEEAFQWIEEDFYVAQHTIKIANDNSMTLQLTLTPGAFKLFNQILIGESIPIDNISTEDTEAVSAASDDQAQTQRDLQTVLTPSDTGDEQIGLNDFKRGETLYSILHGAVNRLDLIREQEGTEPVRVNNLVNALQSLQSRLLTQRYERLIGELAYLYSGRSQSGNLEYIAVNLGPLIYSMANPELIRAVNLIAGQGLNIGSVFSNDVNARQIEESGDPNSNVSPPPPRKNIKMVFGNFNAYAGQWANKPISTFPFPFEQILTFVREEREVGRFSNSINSFIGKIASVVAEPTHYIVENNSSGDNPRRLERPQLKYSFYPDPSNDTDWIFYVYDNKDRIILVSNVIDQVAQDGLTKDDIIRVLEESSVPYLEMGSANNLVRSMDASSQGDDQIMSHNIIQANSRALTLRDLDSASQTTVPTGVTRELITGAQLNPRDVIRQTTVIMPLQVSADTYIIPRVVLFNPIYIFFPAKQFTGLYTIFEVGHEVQNGRVSTKLTCRLELTRQNRIPD